MSGTSLYRVAGFGPLAAAGVLEVAKGAVGPGLATGAGRPTVAALAAGAAVAGHNWSPFLRGAGGRGLSPALGALLVVAWPGAVLLLAGMIIGSVSGETAIGALHRRARAHARPRGHARRQRRARGRGDHGAMLVKRVVGNARPVRPGMHPYLMRLLFDRDTGRRSRRR